MTDKQHNTDSLLNIVSDLDHTLDSLLQKTTEKSHTTDTFVNTISSVYHAADSLLIRSFDTQHYADMLIRLPQHQPDLRNLLIDNIPNSLNVGTFPVKILGIHGNSESIQQFIYTVPSQEFVLNTNPTTQLNIIDPIIKKKIV